MYDYYAIYHAIFLEKYDRRAQYNQRERNKKEEQKRLILRLRNEIIELRTELLFWKELRAADAVAHQELIRELQLK